MAGESTIDHIYTMKQFFVGKRYEFDKELHMLFVGWNRRYIKQLFKGAADVGAVLRFIDI